MDDVCKYLTKAESHNAQSLAILPIVEQVRLQGKAIRDETYSKEKAHRLVASQDNSLYRGQCTDNPRLVVSLWDIINTLWSS